MARSVKYTKSKPDRKRETARSSGYRGSSTSRNAGGRNTRKKPGTKVGEMKGTGPNISGTNPNAKWSKSRRIASTSRFSSGAKPKQGGSTSRSDAPKRKPRTTASRPKKTVLRDGFGGTVYKKKIRRK